ncbi:MAG: hypothetical protein PHH14_06310 [Candidatus Margulisbacteria bacterium]|nr:hypothetical protein [Candidatus Margulisiibacteriota bacterium]
MQRDGLVAGRKLCFSLVVNCQPAAIKSVSSEKIRFKTRNTDNPMFFIQA